MKLTIKYNTLIAQLEFKDNKLISATGDKGLVAILRKEFSSKLVKVAWSYTEKNLIYEELRTFSPGDDKYVVVVIVERLKPNNFVVE